MRSVDQRIVGGLVIAIVAAAAPPAHAQAEIPEEVEVEAAAEAVPLTQTELAKLTQNPVAPLVSVPLQFDFNGGVGDDERTQLVLDFQPVLPIALSAPTWHLITRWIIPIVSQPGLEPDLDAHTGIGDINPQIYVTYTVTERPITLGLGLNTVIPTATELDLGRGQLAFGPAAAAVWSPSRWVIGAIAYSAFSVAGPSDRRDIREVIVQPFVHYNLGDGISLGTSPLFTLDVEDSDYVFQLGGGVAKVQRFGRQQVQLGFDAYWNANAPDTEAEWTVRAVVSLLFPATSPPRPTVTAAVTAEP